jgi:hypothetical protein
MSDISRRAWLRGVALFSVAAVMPVLASTRAEAKVSKTSVHYRDSPKGMQMCHMCKFYIGGRSGGMGGMCMGGSSMMGMIGAGACELVTGRISPMGWCDLYAPL